MGQGDAESRVRAGETREETGNAGDCGGAGARPNAGDGRVSIVASS